MVAKEKRFFDALKNIFIGVPVEGESGYINLMRIKARYFETVIEPRLQEEIDESLKSFPAFREELFDKLYSFFHRYFTESGSIGFFFTPYHQSIYEQVYTDDQDMMLFWKTARLYYVKTDRLFRSMKEEVDGFSFSFDASGLVHKKANEKRNLVFSFKRRGNDGALIFTVAYSERGSKTSLTEIRRAIKNDLGLHRYTDAVPSEETLMKAFSLFERQGEVDYFICKDAKTFLSEQFDLWFWQYLLGKPGEEPKTEWTGTRLKQLQALKHIAYRVIDFIAAFENELVKIWNKPKFVLGSNYVITLNHIHSRCPQLLEKIIEHPGFTEQVKEWQDLKMVDESFSPQNLWETDLTGYHLNPRYCFLPLDTRYFKDMEPEILSHFDDLDEALDGWLINSENYQALKTILPKFVERVQCIYIDPPFNKEQDADYLYNVKYKDSTWATILENRLRLARELLNEKGSIFVRCDYNGNWIVRPLLDGIFGKENFRNEIMVNRTKKIFTGVNGYNVATDSLFFFSKTDDFKFFAQYKQREKEPKWLNMHSPGERKPPERTIFGKVYYPPKGRHWTFIQETIDKMITEGRIRIREDVEYVDINGNKVKGMPQYLMSEEELLDSNWTDIPGYSQSQNFPTENAEILLKRVIESTTNEGDLVMDFFLGSGTTTAVAHKLKRKWIGVELGEHFHTVVLPRMKKVLFFDQTGISREKDVKEKYNQNNAGGIFKYYVLEQYEDVLKGTRYLDDNIFLPPPNEDPCQYLFMRDPKMLEALEINLEQDVVKIDLSKLYEDIDIAETLSNLTGKWIKKIHPDPEDSTRWGTVEFADGTMVDMENLDWQLVKSLIWW